MDDCELELSGDGLPLVNALILLKTSFFTIVGDEQGLTDGVLLAEIVLLLGKTMKEINGSTASR